MRGFKIAQDDEEMDLEDSDDDGSPFSDQRTTLKDLERWEQEAQTWDLLGRLVDLRFPPHGTNADGRSLSRHRPIHQYSSEHEVWEKFLETDELALERKTVLQWLKDTAEESGEDIDVLAQELQENANRGDILAHGWIHTKSAIKNKKRLPTLPDGLLNKSPLQPLVTQLDPDAPTRQMRNFFIRRHPFQCNHLAA